MDVRVHGVGPASDTVPKLVTVLEIGDRRPRATGPCGEPEMDSFADTAASGLLLSKHPVVYNNMLCKVENPKDVSDSSPSVTPSLTCDSPVTQLSPPVNMTSEHVSPSEHGIKVGTLRLVVYLLGYSGREKYLCIRAHLLRDCK